MLKVPSTSPAGTCFPQSPKFSGFLALDMTGYDGLQVDEPLGTSPDCVGQVCPVRPANRLSSWAPPSPHSQRISGSQAFMKSYVHQIIVRAPDAVGQVSRYGYPPDLYTAPDLLVRPWPVALGQGVLGEDGPVIFLLLLTFLLHVLPVSSSFASLAQDGRSRSACFVDFVRARAGRPHLRRTPCPRRARGRAGGVQGERSCRPARGAQSAHRAQDGHVRAGGEAA